MQVHRTAILAAAALGAAIAHAAPGPPATSKSLLNETWAIVSEQFFDPQFDGVDWAAMKERFARHIGDESPGWRATDTINEMLAELGASHTRLYQPGTVEHYEAIDIYREALAGTLECFILDGVVHYEGIGVAAHRGPRGCLHVVDAYDGGPADVAGIRPGDDILFMNLLPLVDPVARCGTHPWAIARPVIPGGEGKSIVCMVQRADGSREEITVEPRVIVPHQMFLESTRKSARVIRHDGRDFAYVRMRSWAGEEFQALLEDLLNGDPLRSCEALILDIRGGWGGANPDAIGLFGCDSPRLEMIGRDGAHTVIDTAPPATPLERQWHKPVVLLVDHGTRSGKEVLAHAFTSAKRGVIVGERTAGAVLAGKPFLLQDGSLLVVAVADVRVDGVRLEGVGVEPDVIVAPESAATADAECIQAAAKALADALPRRTP